MKAMHRKQNPYLLSNNRQYHNLWNKAAVILLVTIAFTNVVLEGSVQKSASEKFTNNKSTNVDELLWKFGTPESKQETYWMDTSDTWEHNEDCCRQGYCEYDENSQNKAWRGRMRAYDCSLHPDHSTTVEASAEVNAENKNKYGFSRKTNVAIAAIGGLAAVQNSNWAIGAIVIIALTAISFQAFIDIKKIKDEER